MSGIIDPLLNIVGLGTPKHKPLEMESGGEGGEGGAAAAGGAGDGAAAAAAATSGGAGGDANAEDGYVEQPPPLAGEYSLRINLVEAQHLLPADESDTPDPKVKVRLCNLPCEDQVWEDRQGARQKDTSDVYLNSTGVFEFELTDSPQEQLEMGTLVVEVWDENFFRDQLLGSWTTDLSDVWNRKDHELWRRWVGLIDTSGSLPGPRGYVKLSICLVAPGDSPPSHDAASIAAADRASDLGSAMMPPTLALTPYELVVELHRAEDLPEMDLGGATGGKCDAFGKAEFMGISKESEVIQSQSPDWTTLPQHPGVPEMIRLDFGMPEGGKLPSNIVTVGIWDRDEAPLDPPDVVGITRLKLKDILANPKKWSRPFWVYFYGAPESLTAGQHLVDLGSFFTDLFSSEQSSESSLSQLQRLMNLGKEDGCVYRGRALIAASIHPKGEQPPYAWKPNPREIEWLLCVELYEASDVPFDRDPKIVISVGPHKAETSTIVRSASSKGRAQWYQTTYMKLRYPDDLDQVPQIFVNLYKGDERTSFVKFAPRQIRDFDDMAPNWEELKRDPFGPLGKSDYAGTLLMSIGFGRPGELSELRQHARKEEESAKTERRQLETIRTEERLALSKHIAQYAQGISTATALRELRQAIQPSLPERAELANAFWLDNLEHILDQLPRAKIHENDEIGLLKRVQDELAKPSSGKQRPLEERMKAIEKELVSLSENGPPKELSKEGFRFVSEYEKLWDDDQSGARDDGSIWRPVVKDGGFLPCGDVVSDSRNEPIFATIAVQNDADFAAEPVKFKRIWCPSRGNNESTAGVFLWLPEAPAGYVALGLVATKQNTPPDKGDYLCVKEEWLSADKVDAKELERSWCTEGAFKLDQQYALWTVPGLNTFWGKEVKRSKFDSRPTSTIHIIDSNVLPGKPTTKLDSYSKAGPLECLVSRAENVVGAALSSVTDAIGGIIPGGAGFSGDGGQWETSWYALSHEALAQYSSKGAFDRYRTPRRVIFLDPSTRRKVDKVESIGPMEEDGFKVQVGTWVGDTETLTFRCRDQPAEAEAWHDVLCRHVAVWQPEKAADRPGSEDPKSPQELKHMLEDNGIQFVNEDCDDMTLVWNSEGSSARDKLSIWRPHEEDGVWFGDYAHAGLQRPSLGVLLARFGSFDESGSFAHEGLSDDRESNESYPFRAPTEFELVAHKEIRRGEWQGLWLWRPVVVEKGVKSKDFVNVGLVATVDESPPDAKTEPFDNLRCVTQHFLVPARPAQALEHIWDNRSMEAVFFRKDPSLQLFDAPGPLTTFYASPNARQPSHLDVHGIKAFLLPDDGGTESSYVFAPMPQYNQRYIRLEEVPKMMPTSDVEAQVEHLINRAALEVERVEMEPAEETQLVTNARVYFKSTNQSMKTEEDMDREWTTLEEELKGKLDQVSTGLQVEKGLIFDCSYELRVNIYQARNLPAADDDGLSDPFVKASCAGEWAQRDAEEIRVDDQGAQKQDQTRIVERSVNPQWNETLYFRSDYCLKGLPHPNQEDDKEKNTHVVWPKLTLHVFDHDQWSKDDFLGRVSIRLGDIKASMYACTTPRWEKVMKPDSKQPSGGEILCSFQLIPLQVSARAELEKLSRPQLREHCERAKMSFNSWTREEMEGHRRFRDWEEEVASSRDKMIRELEQKVLGTKIVTPNRKECTVEVLLLGCRDLKGLHRSPFVEIDIGDPANKGVKVESKASKIPDTQNPNFGACFAFVRVCYQTRCTRCLHKRVGHR